MRHVHRNRVAAPIVAPIVAMLVLSACGGEEPVAEADPATGAEVAVPYGGVDAVTFAGLAERDDVTVIDVRTVEEFDAGRIARAHRVGLADAGFREQVAALDPDREYLVYCRSANRSAQAIDIMNELGHERIWELEGGIIAWEAAGLPVET